MIYDTADITKVRTDDEDDQVDLDDHDTDESPLPRRSTRLAEKYLTRDGQHSLFLEDGGDWAALSPEIALYPN